MRNSTISATEIEIEIRKTVHALFLKNLPKKDQGTQDASLDNTQKVEPPLEIGKSFKSQKFIFLLRYLIIFHFYPIDEKHYCYFYIDLQDHIKENFDSFWLSVLLEDKNLFLKWLEEQKTITVQAFFGNICSVNKLEEAMETIISVFEEKFRRPRRVVRHRGYRDKGSLPKGSLGVIRSECSKDIFLTILQYQIEEKREILSLESKLLKEHLLEGRNLSDEQLVKFRFFKRKDIKKHEKRIGNEDFEKQGNS